MPSAAASSQRDLSSLSNPHEVKVTHLDWKVTVDFRNTILKATATYLFERVDKNATSLCLDTSNLVIIGVMDGQDHPLEYKVYPVQKNKAHLGAKLEIDLTKGEADLNQVSVQYETTKSCSALQWLPPAQTAGKSRPYLFTQCQAIHARSLVPCQDLPGTKMTYTADVLVESWATCVMSAVLTKSEEKVGTDSKMKRFEYEQAVPISSYLLAMAVGDLAKLEVSPRCAIWSEPAIVKAAAHEFAQTEDFLKTAEDIAGMPYAWGRYDLLCLPPSFPYGGMENPCLTFVTPTLLAGDRSLADVVAHEIAHSWTGNLVTNLTWDHFWLNEGWTTWFQRKIMASIHRDDRFLDFDAIGGYKSLQDTVKREMPAAFTKLVLDVGDHDPDDSYSTIAYEKGFSLLMSLERRVGKEKFEKFFQAYIGQFANSTLTSDDFRDFFVDYFEGNDAVQDVDWNTWFYSPGMPPETIAYDRSMAEASEKLAKRWVAVDRDGGSVPDEEIKGWSSNQVTCFLDALQAETESKPLQISSLQSMDNLYGFASSQNAEILFRYCQLAVAAEDESILPTAFRFITSQGRMKYVRPLYLALSKSKMAKEVTLEIFLENKDFYHPICSKMIALDLRVSAGSNKRQIVKFAWAIGVAALAVTVGIVLARRGKR